MAILIQYHTRPKDFEARTLSDLTRQVAREALALGRAPEDAEVSVLYVEDEEMRGLNERYRGIARPTDVLSFALAEGMPGPECAEPLLGDVVISLDTALRQARRARHSLRREIALLLTHGVLHLLGHDHDTGERPADLRKTGTMRSTERACLDSLQAKLVL